MQKGTHNGSNLLLSVPQAAQQLGVSRRTVERLVCRNQFPRPVKIGKKSLYPMEDVQAFVEKLKKDRDNEEGGAQ